MGGNHGKHRRGSSEEEEPVIRATSLDLIYSDNYFQKRKDSEKSDASEPKPPARLVKFQEKKPNVGNKIKAFSDTDMRQPRKRKLNIPRPKKTTNLPSINPKPLPPSKNIVKQPEKSQPKQIPLLPPTKYSPPIEVITQPKGSLLQSPVQDTGMVMEGPTDTTETNEQPISSPKVQPKSSPKVRPNSAPKVRPNSAPKVQPKSSPKVQPNSSPKVQLNSSPKVQPNSSPKVQPISVQPVSLPKMPQPRKAANGGDSQLVNSSKLNRQNVLSKPRNPIQGRVGGTLPTSKGDSNTQSIIRETSPAPSLRSRPRTRTVTTYSSAPKRVSTSPSRPTTRSVQSRPASATVPESPRQSRIPVKTTFQDVSKKRRSECQICQTGIRKSAKQGSVHNIQSKPKKKLVVRGLRKFVDTRKRPTTDVSSSCPTLWKSEFPSKGKFHPDKYIYEWGEGPKAPPRPFSAMAKCRKHGGRCDNCGVFSRDICQSCRKCELDCSCPPGMEFRKKRGNTTLSCSPPFPMEAYKEVFGGDGWSKTCKVLCDLTENEKLHPVGGNSQKRQCNDYGATNPCSTRPDWALTSTNCVTKRGRSEINNKFYQSSIDVLNPYNIPMNEEQTFAGVAGGGGGSMQYQYPSMMMPSPFPYYAMPPMIPSMYSMPCMPFMNPFPMAPPPVMPYFDPLYGAPPLASPYPASEAFMPIQNP